MAPTRFSSLRHKTSPALRRAHFRDDTHLVALRYEKTVPAQPPIPMLPRSASVRHLPQRSPSTSTSSSSRSHSPVVVAPPQSTLPIVPPPTEQHPALRSQSSQSSMTTLQEWKRDSGHAATASSSIPEEEDQDGDVIMTEDKLDSVSNAPGLVGKEESAEAHAHLEETRSDEPQAPPAAASAAEEAAEVAAAVMVVPCPDAAVSNNMNEAPLGPASPPPSDHGMVVAAAGPLTPITCPSSPSSTRLSPSPRKLSKRRSIVRASFWSPSKDCLPEQPTTPPSQRTFVRGSTTPTPATMGKPPIWPAPPLSPTSLNASPTSSDFSPLGITIPTDSLLDDEFIFNLNFSKRGSIMFGDERLIGLDGAVDNLARGRERDANSITAASSQLSATRPDSRSTTANPDEPRNLASTTNTTDIHILTPDAELESQKVRSLYETGDATSWEDGARHSFCERLDPTLEVLAEDDDNVPKNDALLAPTLAPVLSTPRSASSSSQLRDTLKKETEFAAGGGLEDWDDVDGSLVDRYGFITVPRVRSRLGTPTELKSVQFNPRRRNVLQKRDPMGFSSGQGVWRIPSRKVSARSLNTQHSHASVVSVRSSRSVIRQASNLLPHNRNRRWMDEAGDMLTVSPNLQDRFEEAEVEKISESLKRKEWDRSEKWRKMATVSRKGDIQGQGMEFEFDTKNPKLIERTWKGIPDRWRAAAWWAFLEASAKETTDARSAADIIIEFHRLQDKSSADDGQIDLDVPRTISRHIMFRRRYRGGQRLLFRVLHALSIYFPETGYVQGMASLAATLLCYFDEEKCFVMLVRMWQLRGLERLYQPGFEGLLLALQELESNWLQKDIAAKLTQMCIDTTAYGTRWYLTLFNLSIPFPAQLRVWDVFLLLGSSGSGNPTTEVSSPKLVSTQGKPSSGLDILHATSAALTQALREVLLDSDFENAMKALTSWISIKDEDLLMKVTKAEWKTQQNKKRS